MASMHCESRYKGLPGIHDPFQSDTCHQLDDRASCDELRQIKRDILPLSEFETWRKRVWHFGAGRALGDRNWVMPLGNDLFEYA